VFFSFGQKAGADVSVALRDRISSARMNLPPRSTPQRGVLDFVTDSYRRFITEENSTRADDTTAILDRVGGTIGAILVNVTKNEISPEYQKVFDDVIFVTTKIVPPIIITIGIIGNILSFLVLRKRKYAEQSTFVYLRALTFFDSFTLLVYSFQRYLLKLFPDEFWKNGDIFCKEYMFVAYLTMSISHWTLVLMTVDRFIAVVYPLKWTNLCTPRRSKTILVAMTIITVLFHAQQFLRVANQEANVMRFKCPFDYTIVPLDYESIFLYKFVVLVFYIPLFSLLILNVLIVFNVRKRGKEKKKRLVSVRRGQERQMNVMLLLVTSVFTMAVTPYTLDHFFWDMIMPDLENQSFFRELRHVLYEIAHVCIMINPAANFYLYCLGCHKFRNDLKSVFKFKLFSSSATTKHELSAREGGTRFQVCSRKDSNLVKNSVNKSPNPDPIETIRDCDIHVGLHVNVLEPALASIKMHARSRLLGK
jgi:hypothetical protein